MANRDSQKSISGLDLLFSTKEISGIGKKRTVRLLRGRFSAFLKSSTRCLGYTSTRAYGCFSLAFGLLTLLLHLGEYYFESEPAVKPSSLIIGVAFILISTPMLIFDKPMFVALESCSVTDYILFEFFLLKRMNRTESATVIHPLMALFLGFIPAIIGFFLSVEAVVVAIIILLLVSCALSSPEFSMILTLLALPYITILPYAEVTIELLSVITFLSYVIKVFIGKRVYNFGIYDILVFMAAVCIVVGSALVQQEASIQKAMLEVFLMLSYFPVKNLIVNRRLADSVMNAVAVSSVPISLLAISEFFIELSESSFSLLNSTVGISATFINSTALAAFLLVSVILTMTLMIEATKNIYKLFYAVLIFVNTLAFALTFDLFAMVAVPLVIGTYYIIAARKCPIFLTVILIAVPMAIILLPVNILDTLSHIFNNSGLAVAFDNIKNAFYGIKENAVFGIGVGNAEYSVGGIIDVALEMGLTTLGIALAFLIIKLFHLSRYKLYYSSSSVAAPLYATVIAAFSLIFSSTENNIFEDSALLYVFWVLLGACSACLNVAKKEHDDRLGYYGAFSDIESAATDIDILNINR